MKYLLLFSLFLFPLNGWSIEKEAALVVAQKAAEKALNQSYAQFVKKYARGKNQWTPPKHEGDWLTTEPTVTQDPKNKSWLFIWDDQPPAGFTYWTHVQVNDDGSVKVIKAQASFAAA